MLAVTEAPNQHPNMLWPYHAEHTPSRLIKEVKLVLS